MAKAFFLLLAAYTALGGVQAQEHLKPQNDGKAPIAKKEKLFDTATVGVKMPRNAAGGLFDALRDKRVQEEIGLLPLQFDDLLRLNEQVTKDLGPLVDEFNKLPKQEQKARADGLQKEMADYLKSVQADLDRILVPEQQQRLREIAFQLRMQKSGTAQTLLAPDVLRELGMDDLQAERLRESLAKIEEEHSKSLEELELEKERKILALFSPAQQTKLKSFIGPMMSNRSKTPASPRLPNP